MHGEECDAELFLHEGDPGFAANRAGLLRMVEFIAEHGLQNIPSAWVHEANKAKGIYEMRKGRLRLFFFKGAGRQIAVCGVGVLKAGRKADGAAVETMARLKTEYERAIAQQTTEVIEE